MDARVNMMDFATLARAQTPAVPPDELIASHYGLAKKIAWQVFGRVSSAIPIEDLIQIGNMALIGAARTYVDQGTAMFSTYATLRIRGAMIDELRKSATLSRTALRQRRDFGKVRQGLHATLGRPPSETEMAEKVDMAVSAYRTAIDAMQPIEYSSLDDEYSDTNSWFSDRTPAADELMDVGRRREALAAVIAKLPEREQVILQLFFVDGCKLEEISKIFSVSAARICQIKRSTLASMREQLRHLQDA